MFKPCTNFVIIVLKVKIAIKKNWFSCVVCKYGLKKFKNKSPKNTF